MTDIIAIDDELKAEDNTDTLDASIAIAQPMPEPIEYYDDIDIDDDEYDDYVSTPEGKALIERFFRAYENREPVTFEDDELDIFYKECFILTKEELQALRERYPIREA